MSDMAEATKRRLRVIVTETMIVDENAEEAEGLLPVVDEDGEEHLPEYLDVIEAASRYRRMAHHAAEYIEGDVAIEAADDDDDWWRGTTPLDATTARPGYLWSARHFIGEAMNELSRGRYSEGHCPELDALNRDLGRLDERCRLMALAADPATRQLAEDERRRAAERENRTETPR